MVEFLRRLAGFFKALDAKAATSLAISLILLLFVVFMLAFGQAWLNLDREDQLSRMLLGAAQSPWAIVGVISIYSLLALAGFPQILMITGTIIVFGPVKGMTYAWIATMVSATLTFGIGHFLGGRWVRRFGGPRVRQVSDFLARNGVLATALIRVVPSAPFVVVNAAAGAAHIPLWKYWAGTGIGIIPKILLVVALAAAAPDSGELKEGVSGILAFYTSREPHDIAVIAGIVAVWLGFLLLMGAAYRRMRAAEAAP